MFQKGTVFLLSLTSLKRHSYKGLFSHFPHRLMISTWRKMQISLHSPAPHSAAHVPSILCPLGYTCHPVIIHFTHSSRPLHSYLRDLSFKPLENIPSNLHVNSQTEKIQYLHSKTLQTFLKVEYHAFSFIFCRRLWIEHALSLQKYYSSGVCSTKICSNHKISIKKGIFWSFTHRRCQWIIIKGYQWNIWQRNKLSK